ncbi:putative immunity protein [Rhizobium sp. 60-20]|uniref:putative immunity protein n=1 Tax=Rhizobium sp. 60-20 TaxID=1895819 RepID=UPI000ACEE8D8
MLKGLGGPRLINSNVQWIRKMTSPQTLSEFERRLVAAWAADCAERVLWLFESDRPTDGRPRAAIQRARAYARGELNTADEIRRRFVGGGAASEAKNPAAASAARAAGQASAVPHMGAHALGAAAYAVRAIGLSTFGGSEAASDELRWQLNEMTAEVRAALKKLPLVGEDRAGPLGPGLLASGEIGQIIRDAQTALFDRDEK